MVVIPCFARRPLAGGVPAQNSCLDAERLIGWLPMKCWTPIGWGRSRAIAWREVLPTFSMSGLSIMFIFYFFQMFLVKSAMTVSCLCIIISWIVRRILWYTQGINYKLYIYTYRTQTHTYIHTDKATYINTCAHVYFHRHIYAFFQTWRLFHILIFFTYNYIYHEFTRPYMFTSVKH